MKATDELDFLSGPSLEMELILYLHQLLKDHEIVFFTFLLFLLLPLCGCNFSYSCFAFSVPFNVPFSLKVRIPIEVDFCSLSETEKQGTSQFSICSSPLGHHHSLQGREPFDEKNEFSHFCSPPSTTGRWALNLKVSKSQNEGQAGFRPTVLSSQHFDEVAPLLRASLALDGASGTVWSRPYSWRARRADEEDAQSEAVAVAFSRAESWVSQGWRRTSSVERRSAGSLRRRQRIRHLARDERLSGRVN